MEHYSAMRKKEILTFVWSHKRFQIAKASLRKKKNLEVSLFLISNYTTKL